jgi:hypothetical protein
VKKYYFISICLTLLISFSTSAQTFTIDIIDNAGLQHQTNLYHITQDSLVIKAKSDYGRSNVDYLQRKLTISEKKQLEKFITVYPADSLKETYFNEYSNFDYISAENFPRVIEITIEKENKTFYTKATNAYVYLIADLFENVNMLLPIEVKIKYDKSKFNAMY